jgi:hypothetical protein
MKSPRDERLSIWLGGVVQIHVTRACDLSCFNCTQGSNLAGKPVMITPEQFEEACISLKGYPGVVGMFGGNPVLHPQFDELCRIMRKHIPYRQRGLWCNNLRGKAAIARITFNPMYSNLNVHVQREPYEEMVRYWPEAAHVVKGLDPAWPEAAGRTEDVVGDARHSPPWVAMRDLDRLPGGLENTEENRWRLIGECDVNQFWSAMICVVKGELRGYFCEIAGAQAMLHQNEPDWPDLGMPITPGWWNQGIRAFEDQVRYHCHRCGIPLRGFGELAVSGTTEQTSQTHQLMYRPKIKGRKVEIVTSHTQLGERLVRATDYIENSGA